MNNEIKFLWSLTAGGSWDDALTMHFAIAELLWALGTEIPSEWQFRASPLQPKGQGVEEFKKYRACWPDWDLADLYERMAITVGDLVHAGQVFFRYLRLLKAAGKDDS